MYQHTHNDNFWALFNHYFEAQIVICIEQQRVEMGGKTKSNIILSTKLSEKEEVIIHTIRIIIKHICMKICFSYLTSFPFSLSLSLVIAYTISICTHSICHPYWSSWSFYWKKLENLQSKCMLTLRLKNWTHVYYLLCIHTLYM